MSHEPVENRASVDARWFIRVGWGSLLFTSILNQKLCFMPRETTDGEEPIPLTVLAAEVLWLKP